MMQRLRWSWRKGLVVFGVALAIGLGQAPNGTAAIIPLSSFLNGAQETPPNASPAIGAAALQLDNATGNLTWNIVYSGLQGTPTAAHFHQAQAGLAGPVVQDIALPSPAGSPFGILTGSAVLNAVQQSNLLSGLWYINVHSSLFTSGEIRGQVVVNAVPLPASLILFGAGLVGVVGLGRLVRRQELV
ncbi:MAG: CHRD domain-containing protein [Nitrospiraceae bacterium]|nr:CHRD domain-containing protein [Nitrospiraceae bacterium]